MTIKKNVFAIIGSASSNSHNLKLIHKIKSHTKNELKLKIFDDLKLLPPFDPELTITNTPAGIIEFRNNIAQADGIIMCTPEYVFSVPSGLKNAIEWCVATTIFTDKPCGLITASGSGEKGHEELQLIMKTVQAKFTKGTTLLIQGLKGKFDDQGDIVDTITAEKLNVFISEFINLLNQ